MHAMATPEDPKAEDETTRPAAELVREALDETRELIRLEVALARRELEEEVAQLKASAIAIGIAGVGAILALAMFLVAIVTAFRREWLAAVVIGGIMLVLAGSMAAIANQVRPRKPLREARERFKADVKELKERVA
jgi:uncharacterized membrane protein YqjE